jgi:hypothetical protein
MSDEGTRTKTRAVELWVLHIIISIVASALVFFRRISIPHCGQQCDFQTLDVSGNLFFWFCVVLVTLTGVLVFTLRRWRWVWTAPVGGIVLTLAGWAIANRISDVALQFS